MKKYVLIEGVNGAGKSTLFQTIDSLKDMKRVNTDEIVRGFGDWHSAKDVIKAGKIAVKLINDYFSKGISFNQETTLCGSSIIRNIKKAKSLGYEIELHYVGVDSAEIAKKRISHRVANGGHGIPDADVERRYAESLKKLKDIIDECNLVVLYDNTDYFNRFAIYSDGRLVKLTNNVPNWFAGNLK